MNGVGAILWSFFLYNNLYLSISINSILFYLKSPSTKTYLFGRQNYRVGETEKACICWFTPQMVVMEGWARLKPRTESLIWFSHFGTGAQGPGPSAAALPGALAGSCIISEATGTQMGIHMGCQH